MNEVIVKPPQISENTMREMAKFFMKTSIPRIIEAQIQAGGKKQLESSGTTAAGNH